MKDFRRSGRRRPEDLFRRAADVASSSQYVLGTYAVFLAEIRKDPDRADEYFRRALEVEPDDAVALGNYANFLKNVRNDADLPHNPQRRSSWRSIATPTSLPIRMPP